MDLNLTSCKVKTTLNGAEKIIIAEIMKEYLGAKSKKRRYGKAVTVYIEGIMGMGKSQKIYGIPVKMEYIFKHLLHEDGEWGIVDIRMGGKTSSDLQGIPVPAHLSEVYGPEVTANMTEDEKKRLILKWLKDELLPGVAATSTKYGILFLDEINQVADKAVASLLYQLMLDRRISDYVLPDGWFIVAAGNREEDGGIYNRLPAPIRDRMLILEVEPDIQEWFQWARETKVHPAVISYLEEHEEHFHTYIPEKEAEGDEECMNYVFATPRSWTAVSEDLYVYEDKEINRNFGDIGILVSEETLTTQIRGMLGAELGLIFAEHYKKMTLIQLDTVLGTDWQDNAPTDYSISSLVVSNAQFSYLTSIAVYADDTPEGIEKATKILLYLQYKNAPTSMTNLIINSMSNKELSDNYIIERNCVELSLRGRAQDDSIRQLR